MDTLTSTNYIYCSASGVTLCPRSLCRSYGHVTSLNDVHTGLEPLTIVSVHTGIEGIEEPTDSSVFSDSDSEYRGGETSESGIYDWSDHTIGKYTSESGICDDGDSDYTLGDPDSDLGKYDHNDSDSDSTIGEYDSELLNYDCKSISNAFEFSDMGDYVHDESESSSGESDYQVMESTSKSVRRIYGDSEHPLAGDTSELDSYDFDYDGGEQAVSDWGSYELHDSDFTDGSQSDSSDSWEEEAWPVMVSSSLHIKK